MRPMPDSNSLEHLTTSVGLGAFGRFVCQCPSVQGPLSSPRTVCVVLTFVSVAATAADDADGWGYL